MRALDLEATMKAVQILDALGKVEDIKSAINRSGGEITSQFIVNIGIDILAGMCRKNIAPDTVELLAYIFEKTPEEVRKTPIKEYKALFTELAEQNDLKVFLQMCMSSDSPK